jgi:hypothetical protein
MKKLGVFILAVSLCLCSGFTACTKGGNEEPDKGAIDELTDKVAHEAVNDIQKPINKAKRLQKMTEEKEEAAEEVE